MYRFLLMGMLLVQLTVTSAGAAGPPRHSSPLNHGKKADCNCKCVCEVNASSLPLLSCPPPPPPPEVSSTPASTTLAPASGFAVLPRAMYKFFGCEKANTWHNANETCAKNGAYLAVPETMSEVYMLVGMLKFHANSESDCSIFVGLHAVDGKFRTVLDDPMPVVLQNLWNNRGDPDVPEETVCLTFTQEGEIEDEECGTVHAYACKLRAD